MNWIYNVKLDAFHAATNLTGQLGHTILDILAYYHLPAFQIINHFELVFILHFSFCHYLTPLRTCRVQLARINKHNIE
jgi:hypothetical protein